MYLDGRQLDDLGRARLQQHTDHTYTTNDLAAAACILDSASQQQHQQQQHHQQIIRLF